MNEGEGLFMVWLANFFEASIPAVKQGAILKINNTEEKKNYGKANIE
jgi:hypothetical protein